MRLFSDVSSSIADPHLREAFALAERGRGATAPNPLVGCVVVSPSGEVVGRGFHPQAGQPHAEVFALRQAGEAARGATAYVTLEPCSHHGRTPPCADALVAAGIARVVIGMADPSPEASGGARRLVAAGVEIEFAADATPFTEQNAGWLMRVGTGIPLVTAKVGLSLDARPAFVIGERAAITGHSGAEVTSMLRGAADAVLVSAATVDADDPALTVRDARGRLAERQPVRVVLVRDRLPRSDARVLTDASAPTVLLVPHEVAHEARDLTVRATERVTLAEYDGGAGLIAALRELGRRGVNDVLVEPGPRLFSALWAEGLIDRLVTVVAGGMAGAEAPDVFLGAPDRSDDALAHRMQALEAGIVGDVAVTVWRPAPDVES